MSDRRKTQVKTNTKRAPVGPPPAAFSLSRFKDGMEHHFKWLMAILLAAIVVGSIAFFAGTPFANVQDTNSQTGGMDDVMAKVDGEPITRAQLENAVNQEQRMMQMFGHPTSIADEPTTYQQAMKELVQHQVELAAAKKSKVQVSDEDYNTEFNQQVDKSLQSRESRYQTPADFEAYLKSQGKTLADERKTVGDEMYQNADRQGVDLREDLTNYLQVQNFKKQYEEKLTLPRFVRYSQIVVSSNPTPKPGVTTPPSAAEKAAADSAAKAKADSLMKQLQGGADFATLAKSSSSALSKDKGGDEGWANPVGPGAPDYLKGAAPAKINQLLGPIKSSDGYHIVKIMGETTQLPKDAKPETDGAITQAADEQYQKYLDDLVTKAKVVYVDPLIRGVMAQAKPDNAAALAAYSLALKKSALTPEEKGWVAFAAGQLLMSQNQPVQALADFDIALKGDPTSAEAWMAHGDAQNKLNKSAQAKEDYKSALKVATGNPMVLAQLGSKFSALKDPTDAAAAMQAAQQASQRGGMGGMGGGMIPGMAPGGGSIQMSPQGGGSPIQISPQGGAPGAVPAAAGTIHIGGSHPASGHSAKSGGHGSH